MYIDTSKSTQRGKTYYRHLLRETYREDGKVKHRTLANFSSLPEKVIAAIKIALKDNAEATLTKDARDLSLLYGLRVGAVFCLQALALRLGLVKALGTDREGQLALWQVMARLIDQGSRLSAVRLAGLHGVCDILGLDSFTEDHLYDNLAWLAKHQEDIEERLFRQRYSKALPRLFLYDVTSAYLEGTGNAFGAFGYNRDKKEGKRQIVVGLLTDSDGTPVSVRVFDGNTSDVKTVEAQVIALAKRFNVQDVVFVGDRGMLKQPQINLLSENNFHYITAITKVQIRTLLKSGLLQMELFDEELGEVESEDIRYICRRNPQRAAEIAAGRNDKLRHIQHFVDEQNAYLNVHGKAKVEIAVKRVHAYVQKLKMQEWIEIEQENRQLTLIFNNEACEEASRLDGCYVIKTDLPATEDATTKIIHDRYKDLALVEWAFRTFKQGHLEIRPVFVQKEASTEGHVFVVMLAYLLERELHRCWQDLNIKVVEGIDELGSLRAIEMTIGDVVCQKIPQPSGLSEKLLEAAHVRLPHLIPARKVTVATRKKLQTERKRKQGQMLTPNSVLK